MAVEDALTSLLLAHRQGNREASDTLFALAEMDKVELRNYLKT